MTDQELRLKCVELSINLGSIDYADLIYKYVTKSFDRKFLNISDMSMRMFIRESSNPQEERIPDSQ
jgi:hypothetical protein